MAEKRIKTAQVNLRMDPTLKAAAEKVAAAERRSLTSYIEKLIADDLEARKASKKGKSAASKSIPIDKLNASNDD
jgi:hypothetical protein